MNPFGSIYYHWNVNLLGKAFLRFQRLRAEQRAGRPSGWKSEYLSPPLGMTTRLTELISRHYLEGRYANYHRKVAWVTSGGPVEFLKALGFFTLYPENHGALCGARKKVIELSSAAENEGYSRDICSYARTDIGSVLSGKTPVGRLPRPDLLLCCTNICQTVLHWYCVLAHYFQVPLVLIDTPFIYGEVTEHAVTFVKKQFEEAVTVAEKVMGRSLDNRRFRETMEMSAEAARLWMQVMERGKHRPAPISAIDEFIHMAPIVEMRGEAVTVEYYRALLAELDDRIAKGIGAVKNERKRLLWDNLPIWYRIRYLSELFAENGITIVASTYTNAWGELAHLIDPERPLESIAQLYIHPILNRGTGYKLETMKRMIEEYQVDGVILHSNRSCKPYSVGQIDQRERLVQEQGVPALLLEADHNDPRAFSEEQAVNRLAAFIEVLGETGDN
ncbi:MAG: 2-hydroxyacyl-CoA dehydratase [Deltaproteobacteria bacterium]|nr:MAG: 2-hydroxyacyl-CoA dehydratase [Deltaproteobacteria bacterium]